jgi:hypothetical protein
VSHQSTKASESREVGARQEHTEVGCLGSVQHAKAEGSSATAFVTQGATTSVSLPLDPNTLEERWRRERVRASRKNRQVAGVAGAPNLQLMEMHHTRRFDDDIWGGEEPWEDT